MTLTVSGAGGGGGGGRGRGIRDMDLSDLANEEAVARLMRDLEGTVKGMEWVTDQGGRGGVLQIAP